MKEHILVTGGAGFIGSNCANILAEKGYDVVALDNLSLGTVANLEKRVRFVEGDVQDPRTLEAIGPVAYVIHLASSSSAPMFADDLVGSVGNNILGHVQILEYARRTGARKVLYASTSSIYGNNPTPLSENQSVTPPNFYAATKHSQEELSQVYQQVYGLEIIGFRFMSVYGLHEEHKGRFANLVSQFIWGMEQGKRPVLYGDGSQTRDFVNGRDVVNAFELAIGTANRFGSTVFNVGTTRATSLLELVHIINRVMGTHIEPELVPNPVKAGYIMAQQADLSKIQSELGYAPAVALEAGIREIVSYRKGNPVPPPSLSF